MLVLFIQPPSRIFVGVRPLTGDKRVAWLGITLFAIFVLGWNLPFLQRFFAIALRPDLFVLGFIVLFTLAWALTLMFVWRQRLYERWVLGRGTPPEK